MKLLGMALLVCAAGLWAGTPAANGEEPAAEVTEPMGNREAPKAQGPAEASSPGEKKGEPVATSPVGFVKGYTWGWTGKRGTWEAKEAERSMKELAATGTQWATLAFLAHLRWNDPRILWGPENERMVTDEEIRRGIALARANGLKVILKPVIDPIEAPKGKWRGLIEFTKGDGSRDDEAWAAYWRNYEGFMLHYASLAQEGKCELLCIGCEMGTMERYKEEWLALVKKIREVYRGPLIYNSTFDTCWNVFWWDAVEIIGISAYWWYPKETDSSLERLEALWRGKRDNMELLSRKFRRPVMFIEIGCRSARGATAIPGDFEHWEWPYDGAEQARFYEAALRVFWDVPWFCGYSWWDWPPRLPERAKAVGNPEFYAYGKPAEKVLREWYAKPRK